MSELEARIFDLLERHVREDAESQHALLSSWDVREQATWHMDQLAERLVNEYLKAIAEGGGE